VLASGDPHKVTLCDDGGFVWEADDHDGSIAASCYTNEIKDEDELVVDGKVVTDDEGDAVMTETKNVIAGPTYYTTDQMVRAYLMDYPLFMAAAAEGYTENIDDSGLSSSEKVEMSRQLDEAVRDMGIIAGPGMAVASSQTDQTTAEQLLQMETDKEVEMSTWNCSNQGGNVRDDIQFIADNGNAHYYKDGNCTLPDVQVTLAEGLMDFILAAAEKMRDEGMKLRISSLVASHGAPDGGNHPNGAAVDFVCPSKQKTECQTLLNEVGATFGFSAKVSNENYLLNSSSTHAHFSNTGT
jgi:hypothetical protein